MIDRVLQLSCFVFGISILFHTCSSDDFPDTNCENSDLAVDVSLKIDPPNCNSTGSINLVGSGGETPYTFSLDGSDFQTSGLFSNLLPGLHLAQVRDENGCIVVSEVDVNVESSTIAIQNIVVVESGCMTSNGSITVTATGGTGTIFYSTNYIDFNTTGFFSGLPFGSYTVFIRDANNCVDSDYTIKVSTGVSFETDIKPILQVSCIKSGCHNGDNGAARNWSVFANVQANAQNIKKFTGNGTMPADIAPNGLPQSQRDLIACWVDDGAKNN